MYRIEIENDGKTEILHEMDSRSLRRVLDCEFTDDTEAVGSATIKISPQNPAYTHLNELTTLVRIINTNTDEAEFDGRILQIPEESMDSSGKITKSITCEAVEGYLCDTVQLYHDYQDAEATSFLAGVIDCHNALMQEQSPERTMLLGAVTVHDDKPKKTENRSSMEEIKANLVSRCGGILKATRNENNQIVLNYYKEEDYGIVCDTAVEIAVNLKSIALGTDTTGIITRLFPLGCQIGESGERLTISAINGDCPYIDNPEAIQKYGIKCGVYTWDDVDNAEQLLANGKEYLAQSCQIKKSYQAVVLDLSTIGKAADSFKAGNTYRFINKLLGLDEYLRVIRRTVNIFRPYQPTIEIGSKMQSVTDIVTQNRNYVAFELPKQRSEILQQAKNNASALITSATHGFVVVEPDEILIMDTDSKDTATKVWRFNSGGLGYSHSDNPGEAYDGEYGLAMTMDGAIVADYITAGTMYADHIKGGTLTLGGYDNANGKMQVRNGDGIVICDCDQLGIRVYNTAGETICNLSDSGADILGSVQGRSSDGYWLNLHDGILEGGHDGETYTTINARGSITNLDTGTTYNGLLLETDAIDFRCQMFAVNGYIGCSGEINPVVSLDMEYTTMDVITAVDLVDGELRYTTTQITFLSGHTVNNTSFTFTDGLMTTKL